MRSYFDKNKHAMFPEIKDWHDSHDELRYSNNVKDMEMHQWVFFHHTAYKIVNISWLALSNIIFLTMAVFFYANDQMIIAIIAAIMFILLVKKFMKFFSNWEYNKQMNFYDLFMREY